MRMGCQWFLGGHKLTPPAVLLAAVSPTGVLGVDPRFPVYVSPGSFSCSCLLSGILPACVLVVRCSSRDGTGAGALVVAGGECLCKSNYFGELGCPLANLAFSASPQLCRLPIDSSCTWNVSQLPAPSNPFALPPLSAASGWLSSSLLLYCQLPSWWCLLWLRSLSASHRTAPAATLGKRLPVLLSSTRSVSALVTLSSGSLFTFHNVRSIPILSTNVVNQLFRNSTEFEKCATSSREKLNCDIKPKLAE
ncbi:UNVERIFIED_CONTAM: hypothetical protein FKN15_007873 [Acipenser sinensis]